MNKRSRRLLASVEASTQSRLSAFGEHWIPSKPRLCGVPPILKYEAFSSWVVRASCGTGITQQEFLELLGISVPSDWIDAGKAPLDLHQISALTMCDMNSLSHLNWAFDSILSNPQFACLTSDILMQQPIYRYCPACLRSDAIPHIRQSWRMASSYICPIHYLILRECCYSCNRRIDLRITEPKKREEDPRQQDRLIAHCPHCKASLANDPSEKIDQKYLADTFYRQEEIENLIRSTSSYWMPSEFAVHHEKICTQDASKLVWSLTNSQIFLKMLISQLGDAANRDEIRKEGIEKIKGFLHKKDIKKHRFLKLIEGDYMGFSGQKLFNYLTPYIGLQISNYQSIISGTIWYSEAISRIEPEFNLSNELYARTYLLKKASGADARKLFAKH
jgi:TniQ